MEAPAGSPRKTKLKGRHPDKALSTVEMASRKGTPVAT